MLRACVLEFQGSWVFHLALVKFNYNNDYQGRISMAPYEALCGRKYQTFFCWNEARERKLENVELIETTSKKIKVIRDRVKVAQDIQKSYTNTRRRVLEFEVDEMVFQKVTPWKGVIRFHK